MLRDLVKLTIDLFALAGDGKELPKEFRIFPLGKFKTSQGEFDFTEDDAKAVMAAFHAQGNELSIDYDHLSIEPMMPGQGKAAGWFVPELRDDGLWATRVRWTPEAAKMLSGAEYRYFSPAFKAPKKHIRELINVALTNLPATKHQEPLVAAHIEKNPNGGWDLKTEDGKHLIAHHATREGAVKQEQAIKAQQEKHMNKLAEALKKLSKEKLSELAKDCEMSEERLSKLAEGEGATEEEHKKLASKLDLQDGDGPGKKDDDDDKDEEAKKASRALKAVIALTGQSELSSAVGALQAWKQSHDQVVTLSAEVKRLTEERNRDKLEELIARGKKDGKIGPRNEKFCRELGKDLTMLASFLDSASVIGGVEHHQVDPASPVASLSKEDLELCRITGEDPVQYAKELAETEKLKAQRKAAGY